MLGNMFTLRPSESLTWTPRTAFQGNMCHSFNFRRSILKYIEFAGRTRLVGLTSCQIQHVHVMICEQKSRPGWIFVTATIDGSEIQQTHQLRLVVYPMIFKGFNYIPGGLADFWTINRMWALADEHLVNLFTGSMLEGWQSLVGVPTRGWELITWLKDTFWESRNAKKIQVKFAWIQVEKNLSWT